MRAFRSVPASLGLPSLGASHVTVVSGTLFLVAEGGISFRYLYEACRRGGVVGVVIGMVSLGEVIKLSVSYR